MNPLVGQLRADVYQRGMAGGIPVAHYLSCPKWRLQTVVRLGLSILALLASVAPALGQTDQVQDLGGYWLWCGTEVFELTVNSTSSLTLQWIYHENLATHKITNGNQPLHRFDLTINGRALSGNVTVDSLRWFPPCSDLENRQFPASGSISADWSRIDLRVPYFEVVLPGPCRWVPAGDRALHLVRQCP